MPSKRRIPKISIVTPSLNQGQFLQECLDSVRAQAWPDYEHFVVDGGSTDGTAELIKRNQDHLTDFLIEGDEGAADAINKGLLKCTGDIVAWLNADDFYLPGAFEKVAEAWRANPDASFWFGNGLRVTENGTVKAVFNPNRVVYNHRALVEGLDYILQPSTFMNGAALREVGYLDPSLRWSFDWDLWVRLALHSPPEAIEAHLAASREWGETLTANGGFQRAEELRSMIEKYSNKPITYGAACYWLNTVAAVLDDRKSDFGEHVQKAARDFWFVLQKEMQQEIGVDSLGMPTKPGEAIDPLIVAVDLYPLIAGVSGGIVPWIEGVLREMVRLYPMDQVVMFHRPGPPPVRIVGDNVTYVPLHEHPILFYEEMTRHCENANAQAIIRTYPQELHPALPFEHQIFIIPDIQHEYFREFFSRHVLATRRRAFAYALSCGGAIATMTDHSRSTVVNNPWTMSDDVFLMPAALPEELRDSSAETKLAEQVGVFDRFFYMPANLWPHKNHRRLFEAFKRALPHLPAGTGLVLSGNPEGLADVMEGYADLPILHLGFVPHEQVSALFRNADALVYFSLFEGFGMPVLEAFHHGTPVLCSNTTSLPEVGGEAVLACDPTDIDAMAGLMRRILNEEGLKEKLIAKAPARLAAYDWATPARALRAALKRRAHAKPRQKAKPLVSIVMPTRNHGHFIRESIDSVLSQSYPNVELIVMDGASTDDTVEILKSYGERIRWISEPDNGQADAINKGMGKVSGDILAYLNSDDILLPGALEKVVDYFNEHPECDMVYGDADYIDKDGYVTGQYVTAEFSFDRLMHDCCVCQPAAFWRRRAAERTGAFNAELQTAMDYEYWLRLAADGSIIHYTRQKLAQSRLHEDAKTLAMRGKIYEEVFRICREQGGYVSYSYYNGLWSYKLYESWRGGPRLQRMAPRIYRVPALVHFASQVFRLRKDRTSRVHVARTVFHTLDQRFPWFGVLMRKAWNRSATLRRSFS